MLFIKTPLQSAAGEKIAFSMLTRGNHVVLFINLFFYYEIRKISGVNLAINPPLVRNLTLNKGGGVY